MKRHSPTIFVLLITAIFFVVTGCMDIVKTEEGMEKKTESSTAEQTAQPKEEKAVTGKEEAAACALRQARRRRYWNRCFRNRNLDRAQLVRARHHQHSRQGGTWCRVHGGLCCQS